MKIIALEHAAARARADQFRQLANLRPGKPGSCTKYTKEHEGYKKAAGWHLALLLNSLKGVII